MNLHQLTAHAQAGRIEQIELIAIEGGVYLLKAQMHGTQQLLLDDHAAPLRLASIDKAREALAPALAEAPELPFFLVQASAYDEMCGLPGGQREPLRIALNLKAT